MNRILRLGILGAGSFVERRILPALRSVEGLQATCLCRRNRQEAERLAKKFHIPAVATTRQELLAHPEVDAVFIATPNECHEEDAIACAKAGKPVLCEKPLAPTSEAIKRMQTAFEKASLPLAVGHSLRFKPAVIKAKEFLERGMLGELLHIRAHYFIPLAKENWRFLKNKGGGALQDLGVHLIDLIHFISGKTIEEVEAIAYPHLNLENNAADQTVVVIGKLSSQIPISFECSLSGPLRSGFEVVGSKSSLISMHSLRQTFDPVESLCHIQEDGTRTFLPLEGVDIYTRELSHFLEVLNGTTPSLISSDIALKNQLVIDAIYRTLYR